jgi:hypothetical protein
LPTAKIAQGTVEIAATYQHPMWLDKQQFR